MTGNANNPDDPFRNRKWLVGSATAGIYVASLITLNNAWYKDYPKSSFHTFNDSREWLQVDKIGHAWTAYNLSRASAATWNWAHGKQEIKKKQAVVLGSISGFTYLTVIEFLDAHSANWGWSWTDIGANFFGTGLFAVQELAWDEQKINFKFSAHIKKYDGDLRSRANELFGTNKPEKLLKDYNGQTYWLGVNIKSIFPCANLPDWLSVSIGHGAEGLFGGFENRAYDDNGNIVFDRQDIKRYRQWYLSPDIDFTRIKTNSKLIRTLLAGLNCVKFPAPALEFSNNKFRLRPLVF